MLGSKGQVRAGPISLNFFLDFAIKSAILKYVKNFKIPVKNPPSGLWTPLASLTADLENDPETGMAEKKDPATLDIPSASISWVASIDCPTPNAFEIATFCRMAIRARTRGPVPRNPNVSRKLLGSSCNF